MYMVCHQSIRMDCTTCNFGIFFQPVKIKQVVIVCKETGLPVISTLNNMEWDIGYYESRSSWHVGIGSMNCGRIQFKRGLSPILSAIKNRLAYYFHVG